MKYRIKEFINKWNRVVVMPQYKFLFFWDDCLFCGFSYIKEAENYIKDQQKPRIKKYTKIHQVDL